MNRRPDRGIYSIELWGDRQPVNVIAAVKDMMQTVAQNVRGEGRSTR